MRLSGPVKFVLVLAASYGIMKAPGLFMGKPVPSSLVTLYMLFVAAVTLLAMTATDRGARELIDPVVSLVRDPERAVARKVVFTVLPVAVALLAWASVRTGAEPPVELRSVHPAPPSEITAWGAAYDLSELVNPYRKLEKTDPERFEELVSEGGEVYFKSCFYCHGDKLDGRGHYASALTPAPLPFTGSDTIAQLRESYVFWRIVKGGQGLPSEGAPWASSMPAWEEDLTEEDVWKVILFLYDYTGNRPRTTAAGNGEGEGHG